MLLCFRFKDMLDCELITLKAFNSSCSVSSYRLAKLSEGFYKEKSITERKQNELLESISKQNTMFDGVYCLILSIWQMWYCSVLFFSRPRSEGWPHHGRTFSIYPCPLSFWLSLPRGVLSTSWCCPSKPCVAFLACVHVALFLALSLSPGNSLVSSWCDHSMLASLLWRCLTVPSLLQLC